MKLSVDQMNGQLSLEALFDLHTNQF